MKIVYGYYIDANNNVTYIGHFASSVPKIGANKAYSVIKQIMNIMTLSVVFGIVDSQNKKMQLFLGETIELGKSKKITVKTDSGDQVVEYKYKNSVKRIKSISELELINDDANLKTQFNTLSLSKVPFDPALRINEENESEDDEIGSEDDENE